jgi:type II secretory pathway pseudopilin PulG
LIRLLVRVHRDRRRAQSGTTLVEILVSLVIASLALALVVGTLSTGLLNSTLAKRDTAVEAVIQYEVEAVGAMPFNPGGKQYSDCFATEDASSPPFTPSGYQGSCSSPAYTLRADVSCAASTTLQLCTIGVVPLPGNSTIRSLQVFKAPHQ